jgi:hypothetical protein
MPPLPAVDGVLKVVHTGTVGGEPWAGISHWRFTTTDAGPLSTANIDAICAKFVNSWRDNIKQDIAAPCIDSQVEGIDLTTATSASGTATDGDPGDGDEIISPEACVLVSKQISRRYRGGHPRTYWPGLTRGLAAQYHGRAIGDAYVTDLTSHFLTYYTDIPPAVTTDGDCNVSVFAEVCVHYFSAGALLPVPLVDDIIGRRLEVPLATQRRRLHRV